MTIEITDNKTIAEIQDDFTKLFPYLRIEFVNQRKYLNPATTLSALNGNSRAALELQDSMTIDEVKEMFYNNLGLRVSILRKSKNIYVEPSLTAGWSLARQNEQGRQISMFL